MEIDAQKVIDRLRNKLSEKDWEIVLLETQIVDLHEKLNKLEPQEGPQEGVEDEVS